MRNRIAPALFLLLAGFAFTGAPAQAPKDDEQAIRKSAETYSAAFNKGDLEGIMAHWAGDADYVDDAGKLHRGKTAIAGLFKDHLANQKGYKLKLQIQNLRFIRPDVAIEDGTAEVVAPQGTSAQIRYTAVWVKTAGKWLLSSVRDLSPESDAGATPAARLKQLDWLVGDWVHEDKTISVHISCRWAMNKNFLVQEFTTKPKDGEVLNVVVWVGWDPIGAQVRSWFFDSRGGHGEGAWARQGNSWTIESSGVLPDGRHGTATIIWKYVDDKSCLWQSLDRHVGGQPVADLEVKLSRKQ